MREGDFSILPGNFFGNSAADFSARKWGTENDSFLGTFFVPHFGVAFQASFSGTSGRMILAAFAGSVPMAKTALTRNWLIRTSLCSARYRLASLSSTRSCPSRGTFCTSLARVPVAMRSTSRTCITVDIAPLFGYSLSARLALGLVWSWVSFQLGVGEESQPRSHTMAML